MNLFAILILLVSFFLTSTSWAEITGKARVIYGDTIEIAGQRIRLFGIDAPEARQTCVADGTPWPCGEKATLALAEEIAGQGVTCREKDRDRYRRIVAVCYLGQKDLNALMVSEGWALAYRQYSLDYVAQEQAAQTARVGVWRGEFVPPWEWRGGKRLEDAGTAGKARKLGEAP